MTKNTKFVIFACIFIYIQPFYKLCCLIFLVLSFLCPIVLFAMSPKRKASNSPLGGKPDKKGINIKKEKVRAFTEDDDDNKVNLGKNVIEKGNEDCYFYKFKKETPSPEFLDKNHNIKEVEYLNLAL